MRIDVKVSTPKESWITGFNGTLDDAKAYFMGRRFEGFNSWTNTEYMKEAVNKVELV